MTTIHEEAAEALLQQYMRNPETAETLAYQRAQLAVNDDPAYVDWIGQTQRAPRYWPLEQVAAYTAVHAGLMSGRYASILVGVGAEPGPDADREENAAKLASVNENFRADLDASQNGRDSDGWLTWDEPIRTARSTGVGFIASCGTCPIYASTELPPGGAPLEVGYSKPSRTYLHLEQHGGVARWAYGHDAIALLVNSGHPRFCRSAKTDNPFVKKEKTS